MATARPSLPLRNLLLVDAATCGVMGLALVLAFPLLASLTAIPPTLLLYAGLALIATAAFILTVATRSPIRPAAVGLIVAGNAAWVVASVWLMVGGWIAPNPLGQVFIGIQALAVAILTTLEYRALRHAPLAMAA